MLAFNGTVKILDFGIARAAEFAEEEAKKGLIKGKVSYLSPEQIFVRPFDARADVFALGVVFHEMLTGRRLFQSRNDITKMRELLAAPILPPSAIDAMIPRELDRIVMRSLELDPKNRYQTRGRHGRRPGAHADRGALFQPRAVEAAARAVHGRRRAAGGRRRGDDKENLEQTIAITSTETLPPIEHTHTVRHTAKRRQTRMDGVLRAERSRLQWMRWRARIKVMLAALAIAVVVGADRVRRQEISAEPADAARAAARLDARDEEPGGRTGRGADAAASPRPRSSRSRSAPRSGREGPRARARPPPTRPCQARRRDPAADAAVTRRPRDASLLEAVQRDVDLRPAPPRARRAWPCPCRSRPAARATCSSDRRACA